MGGEGGDGLTCVRRHYIYRADLDSSTWVSEDGGNDCALESKCDYTEGSEDGCGCLFGSGGRAVSCAYAVFGNTGGANLAKDHTKESRNSTTTHTLDLTADASIRANSGRSFS